MRLKKYPAASCGVFFILKKSPDDRQYPNKWSFCSGFVKEFEAAEDTVLREIKEETGLNASITRKGGLVQVGDKSRHRNWVVMVFLCSADKEEIRLDHENSEYKWVMKSEIKNYDFVPGILDDLKKVGLLN